MKKTKLLTLTAVFASAQFASAIGVFAPSFDTVKRNTFSSALDANSSDNRLSIGPVAAGSSFRSYLTYDLTSATGVATGVTLQLFNDAFSESNSDTLTQTFTLFSMASDWDGATSPYPLGTDLATSVITVTGTNPSPDISFSSAALTSAYNAAVGSTLYLGIYSPEGEATTTATRSFVNIGSLEGSAQAPTLTAVPEPSATLISAIGLLALFGRRRRA